MSAEEHALSFLSAWELCCSCKGSFNGNRKLHGAGQSGARAPAPTSSEQIIAEKRGVPPYVCAPEMHDGHQ